MSWTEVPTVLGYAVAGILGCLLGMIITGLCCGWLLWSKHQRTDAIATRTASSQISPATGAATPEPIPPAQLPQTSQPVKAAPPPQRAPETVEGRGRRMRAEANQYANMSPFVLALAANLAGKADLTSADCEPFLTKWGKLLRGNRQRLAREISEIHGDKLIRRIMAHRPDAATRT